jgi:trans-2,3-dihydro-3-hydroxyanthranilate isomerase
VSARLRLYHLDVFAERPYEGNPLAVVTGGAALDAAAMQAIARELHLSETVFVLPPEAAERAGEVAARLRIFTPAAELPFAGHPSVGAAWWLASFAGAPAEFALEVEAGRLAAIVEGEGPGPVWVRAPRPAQAAVADLAGLNRAVLAAAGLGGGDLAGPEPQVWNTGNEHHVTLLGPGADLAGLRPDLGALAEALGQRGWLAVSLGSAGHARVRYFAPGLGVAEDPATGSAAAALVGYLAAHAPGALDGGALRIVQGVELGQPSLLLAARRDGDTWIGGRCHLLYQADLLAPAAAGPGGRV